MPPTKRKAIDVDGRRGKHGIPGRWISLDDAKEFAVGKEEWYAIANSNGAKVDIKQHAKDAPKDKPVWRYEHGDMYLGEWNETKERGGPSEQGFGIGYYPGDNRFDRGTVYIGGFKDGQLSGEGEVFWLKSSHAWKENHWPGSSIKKKSSKGRPKGIPYIYRGGYKKGKAHDTNARVTLKDGTTRIGPWKEGLPVGDWQQHPLAAQAASASAPSAIAAAIKQEPDSGGKSSGASSPPLIHSPGPTPGASSAVPSTAATIKQEPGGDTSDGDSSSASPAAVLIDLSGSLQKAAARPQRNKSDESGQEKRGRIQQIRDWILQDIIPHNPLPETIQKYADKLFEEYESVDSIKAYMDQEDVKSYEWMKKPHKKAFLMHMKEW